jgi:hypothetical protein
MLNHLIFTVAYVALSRATSMESLQVLNFDPTKYFDISLCQCKSDSLDDRVVAHPDVLTWHGLKTHGENKHGSYFDSEFDMDESYAVLDDMEYCRDAR